MAKVIKWVSSFGERIINETEERDKREAKRPKGHRKYEYDSLASYKEYSSSGRRRLESLEGAMRFFFEHSGVRLGYMQKRLVDVVIIAMLTKIFGDDLVANLSYIHKKFKIDKLNDTFAIIFPRRSGKTEGSAIMIALILVSQPDGNCIMYNLTGTQAKEFLNSVMNYLKVFKDDEEYGWVEKRRNLNQFYEIEIRKYGTINSVKSYASALKGNGTINYRRMKGRQKEVEEIIVGDCLAD